MIDDQQMSTVGSIRPARRLSPEPVWRPLHYFNTYRLLLAGLFLVLVVWGDAPQPLGESNIGLFRAAALFYFLFGLSSAVAGRLRRPDFDTQVVLQIYVDIFTISIFMHASGGVSSGFGVLLVVAIAGGKEKTCAIRSVLMSGCLSGLITDERTAHALVQEAS